MERRMINHSLSILFLSLSLLTLFNVCVAAESRNEQHSISTENLAPKTYVIQYWDKYISSRLPKSSFLLSKASPLTASQEVYLRKLATRNSLSSHLHYFCSLASIFCPIFENPNKAASKEKKSNLSGSKVVNNPIKKPQQDNPGSGGNDNGMGFQNYDAQFSNYNINDGNNGTSFKNYSDETNFGLLFFKDYSKEGSPAAPSFKNYGGNQTSPPSSFSSYSEGGGESGDSVNPTSLTRNVNSQTKRWVEPGRFFRESELKEGNFMVMPDIRDKMPSRSFLPRSIASKLPFSTSRAGELKQIFKVPDKSPMNWVILNSLDECERAPNRDETKKCVCSIEDMIDFATTVLGHNIVVRNTENVNGTMKNVMVGSVKGVHGGKLTKAVSCHQSFYPYLLYYCHSVPKVKVYEAEILDPKSKVKINNGVAICHIDTSAWSPRHGAFAALGSGPGKIEVCHWIFQNDMIWTLAN